MRIIVFFFALLLFSCTPHDDAADATDIPSFFIATINSQTIGFAAGTATGLAYDNAAFSDTQQFRDDSLHVYEGTTIYNTTTNSAERATVSLMGIFDHLPDDAEKKALFTTGFHRYALSDSLMTGGAAVQFVDGNGVEWSTLNHQQADTSFRIDIVLPVDETTAGAVFQASFSCRLFNALGDSINLENGSVRGKIFKP